MSEINTDTQKAFEDYSRGQYAATCICSNAGLGDCECDECELLWKVLRTDNFGRVNDLESMKYDDEIFLKRIGDRRLDNYKVVGPLINQSIVKVYSVQIESDGCMVKSDVCMV